MNQLFNSHYVSSIFDNKIFQLFILIAINILLFFKVHDFDFVLLDDHLNVYQNLQIQKEISLTTIAQLFTSYTNANWQPITQLTFLIEYNIFGLNPGGYHITNVIIHIANSILVFGILFLAS